MSMNEKHQKTLGAAVIITGLVGFLVTVILGGIDGVHFPDNGSVPAVSILFIIIGMAFFFPDLLQGPCGGMSTMRMLVFIIITVFAVLTVKIGWMTHSFDEFRIDSTWVYILGLAFGGKVVQQMSEQQGEEINRKDEVVKEEKEEEKG
jgi:hypothetical protein